MIDGQRKSFQASMNANRPRTAAAGRMIGKTTYQNVLNEFAPSTVAAWTISSWTAPSTYCRIQNTPNALTDDGPISAKSEFTQPRCCMMMKSGTIDSCVG